MFRTAPHLYAKSINRMSYFKRCPPISDWGMLKRILASYWTRLTNFMSRTWNTEWKRRWRCKFGDAKNGQLNMCPNQGTLLLIWWNQVCWSIRYLFKYLILIKLLNGVIGTIYCMSSVELSVVQMSSIMTFQVNACFFLWWEKNQRKMCTLSFVINDN